jgi:hypothetical protein
MEAGRFGRERSAVFVFSWGDQESTKVATMGNC